MVSTVQNLGFLLNTGLSVNDKLARATKKIRGTLLYIKRSFTALAPRIFLPLYKALIRPHLGCAIHASLTFLPHDSQALESVQKLAMKFVKGLRHVPCEVTLLWMWLLSLVCRRIGVDLICMHEIMHGLLGFPCDAVLLPPPLCALRSCFKDSLPAE